MIKQAQPVLSGQHPYQAIKAKSFFSLVKVMLQYLVKSKYRAV